MGGEVLLKDPANHLAEKMLAGCQYVLAAGEAGGPYVHQGRPDAINEVFAGAFPEAIEGAEVNDVGDVRAVLALEAEAQNVVIREKLHWAMRLRMSPAE